MTAKDRRRDADGRLVRGINSLPRVERGQDIHRVVADLEEALAEGDKRIFQRGPDLVIIRGATAEDTARLKIKFLPGDLVIAPLRQATLIARITEHVDYGYWGFEEIEGADGESLKKRVWKTDLPSGTVLSALLGAPFWPRIRPLRGIAVTPIMHLDGSIAEDGYDEVTQYIVSSNIKLPPISEKPTKQAAHDALLELVEPFAEFPYETEGERFTPVALILTLLFRPVIAGNVPAFVQSAPQKNCGKSLATKAACLIATGRVPAANTWAKLEEEQEKMIGAAGEAGVDVLFFDNVAEGAVIGGAPLDKLLTCDGRNGFRILGRSELKQLPWGGTVCFTANRARIGGDSDRRIVQATLIRRAETITYVHEDLIAYVHKERHRLLAAAFTLARAWIQGGAERADIRRLDSFERWAWTAASMIRWAGGGDVRELVRDTVGSDRDELEGQLLQELFRYLEVRCKRDVSAQELVADVFAPGRDEFEALKEAIEGVGGFEGRGDNRKLDVTRFGKRLGRMKDLLQGGYRLRITGITHGRCRYAVERTAGVGRVDGVDSSYSSRVRAGACEEESKTATPASPATPDKPKDYPRSWDFEEAGNDG